MGINIFGKFENRQDGGKLMDYVDIEGAPILEEDLSASVLRLVANSYYKHIGARGKYITGVVYYFDGQVLKPIDGSGALGEVAELETEQVAPGEIDIDSEPIKDSPNVITSGGTYKALEPLKISIAAIQEDVGKIPRIAVDETLSPTSTNPISNKAVNAAVVQVNNKINEVENKITQTGDYVDTKSTQTITGTKVFNNIQADDILFKTEDGKGYNCHLTGNPTTTPDSAAPLKIYLPKKKGTLAIEKESYELLKNSYQRVENTSYGQMYAVSIPLDNYPELVYRQNYYEIEWTHNTDNASHVRMTLGDIVQDTGALTVDDKYLCQSVIRGNLRFDFYAMISIDDEDDTDKGTLKIGFRLFENSELLIDLGQHYVYFHYIKATER